MERKVPSFSFGGSGLPVAFNSKPALIKRVEELGAKIDAIDDRLNSMNSLLSSILKLVTRSEQKELPHLDTSGCKSAGDCPTLPPKLWTRIFLHLERYELLQVRMTCRSWKQLVDSNSALREGFAISFPEGSIMDREYLPADLPPASKVTLRKVRIIEVAGWWPSLGNTLVHLCLSDCTMRASMLVDILRQTPKLKILELESSATILDREEILTKPKLELIELECLVLDQIDLLCKLTMPKEVLTILFRMCPQLEVLDLQQMAHVDNEVVELACQKMRKLKRLTLDRCPLTDVPAIEQYRSQLEYLRRSPAMVIKGPTLTRQPHNPSIRDRCPFF
ncbi:hypothetical protein quinque_002293 [Culex quinquefasciatus]